MKKLPVTKTAIMVRLEPELKKQLERIAAQQQRSINNQVAWIITDWLNNPKRDR